MPLESGVASMISWLEAKFARHNLEPSERSRALALAFASIMFMFGDGVNLVILFVLPPVHDHELLGVLELWSFASFTVLYAVALLHLYYYGLTTPLKVAFLAGWALAVVWLDFNWPNFGYYFILAPELCICEMMKSGKDTKAMNMTIAFVCSLVVVYGGWRALDDNCAMPGIHPLREYDCEGATIKTSPIVSQWLIGIFAILVNFVCVKVYMQSCCMAAETLETSIEVATVIAGKLVNFDLVGAEDMLDKAMDTSPVYQRMHQPLFALLENLRSYRSFLPYSLFSKEVLSDPPNAAMAEAMRGQHMSLWHAANAVGRLREEGYSLKQFHDDVSAAFPELQLYSLHASPYSSGHTGFEEYQRTLGALYSVYCLARLDIDGKEVLSFGVDEQWRPRTAPHGPAAEKMRAFYSSMDWDRLEKLLQRANILVSNDTGRSRALTSVPSVKSVGHVVTSFKSMGASTVSSVSQVGRAKDIQINHDRMMALIVLTAIHDIMKNTQLLPTVQRQHSPYHDHATGSKLCDHDLALAYIMEWYPAMLPSYLALEPGQRAPILFTQGKMGFNNGWLVQGEAPPGALFSTFKRVVMQGGASQADISFYFVHWLTDLAGAEPHGSRPWPGAEKFVVNFPMRVLNAFLESFSFVGRLASHTEVDVMEEYLESRWSALGLPAHDVGTEHRLAARRLALMAQGFEADAVRALQDLGPADRDVVALEMALTGRRQQFRDAPGGVRRAPAGPALLVYYAPALVQKAGAAQAGMALAVLASVYRAARELFPLDPAAVERTAVVRIDALKVLTPLEILASGIWHLKRTSEADAEVVQGQIAEEVPRETAVTIAMSAIEESAVLEA